MKIAPQAWTETPGGSVILRALDAVDGTTRLVGGAVRDALLGLPVTDIDLATALSPGDVTSRLEAAGVQVVPTGIAHGTVTAVTPDVKIEVTTLRRDVSTDGRRATVAYTDDWREDAGRRDFTMNALYATLPSGEISDFFGGLDDLEAGRVRFIGQPLARIQEDHLRILRFFRFHGRFGDGPADAVAVAACEARANDLMALSRERIRDELLKILLLDNAAATMKLMLAHGILKPVLPEIEAGRMLLLAALAWRENKWGANPDAIRRLASILPENEKLFRELGPRLRLSKREAAHLVALGKRYGTVPPDPLIAAYWEGAVIAADRLLLLGDEAAKAYAMVREWRKPVLPISGKDLIAMGVAKGPDVSRQLLAFERVWVTEGFPTDPASIQRLIAASR